MKIFLCRISNFVTLRRFDRFIDRTGKTRVLTLRMLFGLDSDPPLLDHLVVIVILGFRTYILAAVGVFFGHLSYFGNWTKLRFSYITECRSDRDREIIIILLA